MKIALRVAIGVLLPSLSAVAANGTSPSQAPPTGVFKLTPEQAANSPLVGSSSEIVYPQPLYVDQWHKDDSARYRSIWQESVKAIYRKKLVRARPDILVIPFEVQIQPIDKIGRSLMTRILGDRLEKLTSKSVSEFDLVDRALGDNRSRFLVEDIEALVREVNPQIYVRTYVGHRSRNAMFLTTVVYSRDPEDASRYREIGKETWTDLFFNDTQYPYQTFAAASKLVARFIIPNVSEEAHSVSLIAHDDESRALPDSPEMLVNSPDDDPVRQAFALQTLGMLAAESPVRERDRLFEKSLMVLAKIPPSQPDYALLKARALFYLARRPGAVEALTDVETNEERALRYYLDADLVGLAESVEQIRSPWKKFLARLELHNLAVHFSYQRQILPTWKDEFFREYPGWKPIVTAKLSEYTWPRSSSRAEIKQVLDDFLPLPAYSLEAALVSVPNRRRVSDYEVALTEAVANHALAALGSSQLETQRSKGVTSDDYIHLLNGITRFEAIDDLRGYIDRYDLPDHALELARTYLEIYAGDPDFLLHEARANARMWKEGRGLKRDSAKAALPGALARLSDLVPEHKGEFFRYYEQLKELMKALETEAGYDKKLFEGVKRRRREYQLQFPPRFTGRSSPSDIRRHVEYAHADIGVLQYAVWRTYSRDKDFAKAIVEENRHRFVGHRSRPEVLAWIESVIGDTDSLKEHYQKAVDSGSHEWSPYWEVLVRSIASGDYEHGFSVVERYPGFLPASTESRVRLSNRAFKAGSTFFWKGAYEQAKSLYELSARYETGSGGEMASLARIATINGDYATALIHHFRRGRRYNSVHGYRDAMSLLHVLGESHQAWALFDSRVGVYEKPEIWTSALVGHRVAGSSTTEIEGWVSNESRMLATNRRYSFPARFGLMALTMDRAPNDDVPDILERLGRGYEHRVTEPTPNLPASSTTILGKWGMALPINLSPEFGRIEFQVGDIIESEYSLFARGYNALKGNEYEVAYRRLMRLEEFYSAYHPLPDNYAFPYLVRAALKSGHPEVVEAGFERGRELNFENSHEDSAFYVHLAKAFGSAENGDHDGAVKNLEWAFGVRPNTGSRPIMTLFQMVEAALWLYEDFKDPRYLSLALEWSRNHQVVAPMYAWPYAVEAKYSDDPEKRRRALGIALYLDRDSWLLSEIPDSEKEEAGLWFAASKPFSDRQLKKPEPMTTGS